MKTVLITGVTGLIGKHLSGILRKKRYNIAILSRSSGNENNIKTYKWNPATGEIDPEAIYSSDYIIHLAGAGIGDKRWTDKRKQEIIDSRVKSGELLYEILKKAGKRPAAFISASGIG
jgi:NAD dependent epimerase/dehydratase family enzyme